MKKAIVLSVTLLLFLTLTGCSPDLVVEDLEVTWNASEKKATAEIANIGNKDAGSFLVYFNANEDPVSPNHRPQVSHNVPGLAKGESITLEADFAPLAHPDNEYLGNVYKITVIVDPKDMVKESDEENNTKEYELILGTACVDFGPPPALDTKYGSAAGNAEGDEVLVSPDGIKMSVHKFWWNATEGTFTFADIVMPPRPLGSGQTIHTNNINLEFDFSDVGFSVGKVEFEFLDMGGMENLSVNGLPASIYTGELTDVPAAFAGVTVAVTSAPVTGGKRGTVVITGAIEKIMVGGQELWIDNVCAEE